MWSKLGKTQGNATLTLTELVASTGHETLQVCDASIKISIKMQETLLSW